MEMIENNKSAIGNKRLLSRWPDLKKISIKQQEEWVRTGNNRRISYARLRAQLDKIGYPTEFVKIRN